MPGAEESELERVQSEAGSSVEEVAARCRRCRRCSVLVMGRFERARHGDRDWLSGQPQLLVR